MFEACGESLAGRYFTWRLHPFSVRELSEVQDVTALQALARLIDRGGFPEPCLAATARDADRWRAQYATDLIREDVMGFSRVHEVRSLQLLFDMLRERVGSPVKLSNLAQALNLSPTTVTRYVDSRLPRRCSWWPPCAMWRSTGALKWPGPMRGWRACRPENASLRAESELVTHRQHTRHRRVLAHHRAVFRVA